MSSSSDGHKKGGRPSSQKKTVILHDGWILKESRSHPGRFYYFNVETGKSTWDEPPKVSNKGPTKNQSQAGPSGTSEIQTRSNRRPGKTTLVTPKGQPTVTRPSTSKDAKKPFWGIAASNAASPIAAAAAGRAGAIKKTTLTPLSVSKTTQKSQVQTRSTQNQARATQVTSSGQPTVTRLSSSKNAKKPSLGSAAAAVAAAAASGAISKNTPTPPSVSNTTRRYLTPKSASHNRYQVEDTIRKIKKDDRQHTQQEAQGLKRIMVDYSEEESTPQQPTQEAAPGLKRKIIDFYEKKSTPQQHIQQAAQGLKRKIVDFYEKKSTLQPVKKCLKTTSTVVERDQLRAQHSVGGASTSQGNHPEADKRSTQEQALAMAKKHKKKKKRKNTSIAESTPGHQVSSSREATQQVIAALPRKQKSLTFFSDEDKDAKEDTSVPMDVEMEDIEADEVRGHLYQIRDELNSVDTPDLQVSTKFCLPDRNDSSYTESHKDGLYIVLDTNVLISHLTFLEELRDQSLKGFGKPILIVPWVVLQELDGLKMGRAMKGKSLSKVAKQSVAAGNFIHTCIKSHHPRVQCQSPQSVQASKDIPVECNDDRVLQCCLQYKQMGKGMLAVLFSNDVNLCTKAMVSGVSAFTKEDLLSGLKDLASSKSNTACPSTNTKEVQEPSPCKVDAGKERLHKMPSKLNDILPSQDVKPKPKLDVAVSSQTGQCESDLADDILCEMKTSLTEGLSVVLEREMKSVFDEQWLDIVFIKPPWTFKDLLRCFEKHWIAVFGMFMSRVEQGYLSTLQEHFKKTTGYGTTLKTVSQLVDNAHHLCLKLFQNDKSNSALQQTISTLVSLSEKCNKTTPKETKSGQPSTSTTATPSNDKSVPNRTNKSHSGPDRESASSGSKQTYVTPLLSNSSNASQDTPSTSQEREEEVARGPNRRSSYYDDGDVEMISEEICVPSVVDDDSTTSVLQVFQSVGETIFSKSADLLTALHQSDHQSNSQFTALCDRHMVERSLVLLCYLLLTVVTAMARLLSCNSNDESSHQGICDALDNFTIQCEINPVGSRLHPATFQSFMSVQSNKETLANGLRQFAGKLQELHEHIVNLDSDLYTNCRQTLIALASQALC